jgi:ABC-type transport system substrate-binding protein
MSRSVKSLFRILPAGLLALVAVSLFLLASPGQEPPRRPLPPIQVDEDGKSLAQAVRDATNPVVRELFEGLVVPHDLVTLKAGSRPKIIGDPKRTGTLMISLLPERYGTDTLPADLSVQVLNRKGQKLGSETVNGTIEYYENRAVREVKDFLAHDLAAIPPADKKHLSRLDQLQVADEALSAVVRFHESARERGIRKEGRWDEVKQQLRLARVDVWIAQVSAATAAQKWDEALEIVGRLAETLGQPGVRDQLPLSEERLGALQKSVDGLMNAALKGADGEARLPALRGRLRELLIKFPDSPVVKPISENLRGLAEKMLVRAREWKQDGMRAKALEELERAWKTYPELPGLRDLQLELDSSDHVLRVSVRELPLRMSPALATTDSELRAVDLLFEGLLKRRPADPSIAKLNGVTFYEPGLAEDRPKVVPLGREFRLPRGAKWSDGKRLTVADIRRTVRLLRDGEGNGMSKVWERLIKGVEDSDASHVRLQTQPGFPDQQALALFKILPAHARVDSEEFAKNPIGSGPFRLQVPKEGEKITQLSFTANEAYGMRESKRGLPHLKEIRLHRADGPNDPYDELKAGRVHLALDLTAKQALAIQGLAGVVVPPPGAGANRRICFLAVNNGHPALSRGNVRVALARAINREKLLDDHFRGAKGSTLEHIHHAINGPYPAGSWACDPMLVNRQNSASADPFDPVRARGRWSEPGTPKELTLKLKYPAGDAELKAAMSDLCNQLNTTLNGLHVTPEERSPHELRKEVEAGDYDLAYYHYDFPDETFWLLPLLGPQGAGRANYLKYSGPLVATIDKLMSLRNFADVRAHAQQINREFLDTEMPFVPLWQLDPLYAYRKGVQMPAVDPSRIFSDAELWSVKR